MKDIFCSVTRCIVENNGCLRLTETRIAGYYTDVGKEQITACCGKSIPYRVENKTNAAPKAA